ncbi:MAG: histidine phosphatase family protein, partial [Alphaproteobacteria bacterium]|nr:histidine phosphatase family protein [Alphaproteobacteria bacterium]
DLPLVETERGTNVGKYLRMQTIIPDIVFSAPLKRTMETARLAIAALDKDIKINIDERFREIDYGPDEGKTEEEVIARIGQKAIEEWDRAGIVPDGWSVSVEGIIEEWKKFACEIESEFKNKTVMVVSSNGVIRFAPYLTGNFEKFSEEFNIKVATGSVCILEKDDEDEFWHVVEWGTKPKDKLVDKTAPQPISSHIA